MTVVKTSLGQRIGLIFFGLAATVIILEIFLRLGGWIFLARQEGSNRRPAGTQQEYRILCLGESTTALGGAQSYPRQLQDILNARQKAVTFKVINKGVPATTTDQILSRVPHYFAEYQPHMVVAMMGVNDPENQARWTWRDKASRYSKSFKLFDMIVRHLSAKKLTAPDDELTAQIAKIERQGVSPLALEIVKANLYRSANRPVDEKGAIDKILGLDPQNGQGWFLSGLYYERHAENEKALASFQNALPLMPANAQAAVLERIAQAYKLLNENDAAIRIYREILNHMPWHPEVNGVIGGILLEQEQYQPASEYFLKQIAVDPHQADVYDRLAYCYRRLGRTADAERIAQRKNLTSEKNFEKESKNLKEQYNSGTKANYLRLVDLARHHQVPLVAMQYPLRPAALLRNLLGETRGVMIVDNSEVFARALAQESYDALFSDRFAGDFGHCTAYGNKILAENLADVILQYFGIEEF